MFVQIENFRFFCLELGCLFGEHFLNFQLSFSSIFSILISLSFYDVIHRLLICYSFYFFLVLFQESFFHRKYGFAKLERLARTFLTWTQELELALGVFEDFLHLQVFNFIVEQLVLFFKTWLGGGIDLAIMLNLEFSNSWQYWWLLLSLLFISLENRLVGKEKIVTDAVDFQI